MAARHFPTHDSILQHIHTLAASLSAHHQSAQLNRLVETEWLPIARGLHRFGDYESCEVFLNEYLDLFPFSVTAHTLLQRTLEAQGRYAEACFTLEKGLTVLEEGGSVTVQLRPLVREAIPLYIRAIEQTEDLSQIQRYYQRCLAHVRTIRKLGGGRPCPHHYNHQHQPLASPLNDQSPPPLLEGRRGVSATKANRFSKDKKPTPPSAVAPSVLLGTLNDSGDGDANGDGEEDDDNDNGTSLDVCQLVVLHTILRKRPKFPICPELFLGPGEVPADQNDQIYYLEYLATRREWVPYFQLVHASVMVNGHRVGWLQAFLALHSSQVNPVLEAQRAQKRPPSSARKCPSDPPIPNYPAQYAVRYASDVLLATHYLTRLYFWGPCGDITHSPATAGEGSAAAPQRIMQAYQRVIDTFRWPQFRTEADQRIWSAWRQEHTGWADFLTTLIPVRNLLTPTDDLGEWGEDPSLPVGESTSDPTPSPSAIPPKSVPVISHEIVVQVVQKLRPQIGDAPNKNPPPTHFSDNEFLQPPLAGAWRNYAPHLRATRYLRILDAVGQLLAYLNQIVPRPLIDDRAEPPGALAWYPVLLADSPIFQEAVTLAMTQSASTGTGKLPASQTARTALLVKTAAAARKPAKATTNSTSTALAPAPAASLAPPSALSPTEILESLLLTQLHTWARLSWDLPINRRLVPFRAVYRLLRHTPIQRLGLEWLVTRSRPTTASTEPTWRLSSNHPKATGTATVAISNPAPGQSKIPTDPANQPTKDIWTSLMKILKVAEEKIKEGDGKCEFGAQLQQLWDILLLPGITSSDLESDPHTQELLINLLSAH
ncbi:hypothetical protein BJ085DRAFT_38939 [Dimargaris cristalligena]|uniref:Uncharacterized protein n=1 Tax=Dimargaris cristalligena TaxID=215637 RepID=A0A4P9ZVK1_9FUNG|nr:hypothetical protein BJ085DRAFT_38939 [Dimargaris cristalligena]|eukprot:RKP36660.1 hypothetical protein BJ085DRAFT_38939 [Dimargaris cristalligena]